VEIEVPAAPAEPIAVTLEADFGADRMIRMARSIVGAYAPLRSGGAVSDVRGWGPDGAPVPIALLGADTWRAAGPLRRLAWRVDGERSEDVQESLAASVHRRVGYTFLNGAALFLRVEGSARRAHRVRLRLPAGWRVAWALREEPGGTWLASDLFELIDEPAMLGTAFRSEPAAPALMVHVHSDGPDGPDVHVKALAEAARLGLKAVESLRLPPLGPPYHVFFELYGAGTPQRLGWAQEHGFSFHGVDAAGGTRELTPGLAYHFAHHMLHAWLPRRLFTDRLRPDRQLEGAPTAAIWFAEGFAQYLALVGLARTGAFGREDALARMQLRFGRPVREAAPGEPISLAALSLRLCGGDHAHWAYEYGAGALLAAWIDQRLAEAKLPDLAAVTPRLLDWCRDHPDGIPEERFDQVFREVSGLDVTDLFERYVRGTVRVPVDEVLKGFGTR